MVMLGLGDSVGTPPDGVQAQVMVVHNFERARRTRGRRREAGSCFFNVALHQLRRDSTLPIGRAVSCRAAMARWRVLVRSVGPAGLRTPHTGALQYSADAPKIPAAAITTEDADRIQRIAERGTPIVVRLKMEAHFEPDVESANVIGELRGREKPDEVVVVGGHLDSWDVGAGATDDGGGCVVTWEALRIMKKLNLRPRRTVRVVLFTNEENGDRGGIAYRDQHHAELSKHVMMLESDDGVFRPLGFGFTGNDAAAATVRAIATLLTGIAADQMFAGGGGADIGPERAGRPHPRDGAGSRRLEILPDPPHAGRHDRQNRSGRDGKVRGGRRGHDVRHRGPAAATRG